LRYLIGSGTETGVRPGLSFLPAATQEPSHSVKRTRHAASTPASHERSARNLPPTGPATPRTLPPSRRWRFRLVAAVVVPVLFLALLEIGLRFAGYGHPTSFFLRTTSGGDETLVENTWFGLRFFPPALSRSPAPVSLRARKPSGVYRIFLFGESAALGDPRPAYGAGRYLEVLLRDRFPTREFEVVCVAMTAINSHAILPIARECARHEGDLWIVYAGNNEMAGPFGANTVFGPQAPPRLAVRAYLAVQRLRVGQLFANWMHGVARETSPPGAWGGLKMFLDRQLPLDHPGRERVYDHFRHNLSDLVRTGRRAGVPILLSSVASNLKDCAPFASSPAPAAGGPDRASWEALGQSGDRLAMQGRWAEAATQFQAALQQTPRCAELHFRRGQSLVALADFEAARKCFEQARDLDLLPFRADSRINAVIEETARRHAGKGVLYVDAMTALTRQTSVPIPGQESFYEHVHLNPDGNYRLARAWAESIAPLLAGPAAEVPAAAWAEPETCAQRLGLTDWNRQAALEEMLRRLLDAPFTNQFNHAVRLDHLRRQLADARDRMRSQSPQDLRSRYEAAIRNRPHDHWLHHNYAEFLKNLGDLAQATVEMRRVRDLLPHHYAAYLHLGRLLARQKKYDEARQSLVEALRRRPDLSDAYVELGQISASQGKLEEALANFDAAMRQQPESVGVYLRRADVLMALKRREAAIQSLRDAILLQPSSWETRYLLGVELATDGNTAEAQAELAEVVRLRPEHVLARLNLGNLLARQERFDDALAQFREALRLDPLNPTARESVATLEQRHFLAAPP